MEKTNENNGAKGEDRESKFLRISPPGTFSFEPEDWEKYKARFVRYMSLSGNDKLEDNDKVNCLLYCMGEKAEDIIIQFGTKLGYTDLLSKFDDFFSPKKNIIYERYKFNSRVQKEGEKLEEFLTDIHKLALKCEYGVLKEDLIRDKIVIGISDKSVSERLLLKSDLTLKDATLICRQAEIQKEESKMMGNETIEVNRIKQGKKRGENRCWFCGLERHRKEMCPANNSTCHNCKRIGHFAKVCRSKGVRRVEEEVNKGTTHEVSLCEKKEDFMIDVQVYRNNLLIDKLNFLIDTGADISAVSENWASSFQLPLVKCADTVKGPDGSRLDVTGTIDLELKYKNNTYQGKVYVIKGLKTALLGRTSIDSMNLIKICAVSGPEVRMNGSENIEKEFPSIFSELGVFKDEFHIDLVENPKSFIQASPRNISIPLLPKVKQELDRLEQLGIVSPIEEATDFVSPIVVVLKNNKVRICGDYTQVNKNIKRPVYPIPKIEHTLAKLKGAKFFSKIDATSGFHQIKLDDTSKKLTTIITPFGRYIYNRLPFGLNCAPEYFSMKFSNLFKDMKLAIHMDDILIYEPTKEDHDKVLHEVLKRLHNAGITINKNKCLFGVEEICYLGHVINASGIKIDPERTKAISNFKEPSNKKELLQFLGMVNFVGRYIPNKSEILNPLHILLKEDQMFVWGPIQTKAFNEIKEKLQNAPTLAHYDVDKVIIISADSSSFGLGAALMQEDRAGNRSIVTYASRTLTDAEKHYAQIEKEGLALVWAVEKFRDYVLGIHVILETDHKPLLQILHTKPLDDLSPRLLRFRLKLSRFNYEVKYIPGKEQVVADALSRQPLPDCGVSDMEQEEEGNINMIVLDTIPNEMLDKIYMEQGKCNICIGLKSFTANGWPNKTQLGVFKNYYQYKNSFSMERDLLLYNSRIVIPENMHKDILKRIHEGHLGISKCRERARQSVWWLGLSRQIEEQVKSCPKCIETSKNHKEKMVVEKIPDRPWQKVGMDLFKFNNNWYLVIIDYYSRFLEICKLKDLTEYSVIIQCKNVFSRFGIPEVVRSDCGTQFKSKFNEFAKEYGFKSITSSPYFSQSNGLAESGVKIAKSLLSKNEDIYLALLIYRNTPIETGYSPAEMLFNRKLRDNLPILPSKLNKPVKIKQDIQKSMTEKKNKDAYYYNKSHRASNLEELKPNDKVWIIDLKIYGTIETKCEEPRSYVIMTDRGKFRRNRWHLVRVPQHISPGEGSSLLNRNFYDDSIITPASPLDNLDEEEARGNIDITANSEQELRIQEQDDRLPKRLVRRPKFLDDYETNF